MAAHAIDYCLKNAMKFGAATTTDQIDMALARKAADLLWKNLGIDPSCKDQYINLLKELGNHEAKHGDADSKGKMAKELARALRELEWPRGLPEDQAMLEEYLECLHLMSRLGRPEEAFLVLRERGPWMMEQVK